jgi:signal transduction histidine kinase
MPAPASDTMKGGLERLRDWTERRFAGGAGDPDRIHRARILFVYAGTTFVVSLVWGLVNLVDGIVPTTIIFFVVDACILGLMARLWRDGNVTAASHGILALASAAVIAATWVTGGLRTTNVTMFFMVIVASIFLLGRRGVPYAVGSMLAALGFQVGHWLGYEFPDHVPPGSLSMDSFITWFVSAGIVFLFALAYERARVVAVRRLEESDRLKTQFIANTSHEIRTPLHVIMGTNRVLERSGLDPGREELVRASQQSTVALMALIGDLLDMASIEHGSFRLSMKDFDPSGTASAVAGILRGRCEEKGLAFELLVDPALPRRVRGDEQRLRQVLLGVGGNAVKYTDAGKVSLEAGPAGSGSGHGLRFVVSDTGIGIEDRDRARIFESFTQADGTLARKHDGAGLGLHLSSRLVSLMGGTIRLESRPGEGSTFVVEVPFEPPAGEGRAARDAAA